MIGYRDIKDARERLGDSVFLSPCAFSETFSKLTGMQVYFKLENLQMTGSFKERGALNRLLLMPEDERQRGVIAASAGNHAQGVAYHASRLGIAATIVMPERTPLIKVVATREFGAQVILHGAGYDDACAEATRLAEERNHVFVHAFDDDLVIAGQGTIGLELLEQQPDLEAVIAPIGGGGLISGIACALKESKPSVRIIGVQTERVQSARRALENGAPVTVPAAATLADGIAVRRIGERTLPMIERYVDDIACVSEEEIANAILLLLEREKTVAEGAGAVPLAAAINQKAGIALGKRVALLVCGGNIDVNLLSRIIDRGLAKDGRLVKLEVRLSDSPGALHELIGVFANLGANVLDIAHARAFAGVELSETVATATLETRGTAHVAELLTALRKHGYQHRRCLG